MKRLGVGFCVLTVPLLLFFTLASRGSGEIRWCGEGWVSVYPLTVPRAGHTQTLLNDGRVLVVGGWNGSSLMTSVELYDSTSQTFGETGGMHVPRVYHTATRLNDGRVLVVGGADSATTATGAAEIYDPHTETWTPAGLLQAPRIHHTATLLADGRVLIAGGWRHWTEYAIGMVEVFDPVTGEWSTTGSLNYPRLWYTATLLKDGQVLIAGGVRHNYDNYGVGAPQGSSELYDPSTGQWSFTGPLNVPRYHHSAYLTDDGRVLIATGLWNTGRTSTLTTSAELFDPATGQWDVTGSMAHGRIYQADVPLADGRFMVIAGTDDVVLGRSLLSSTEIYDPASRSWVAGPNMMATRYLAAAGLLKNGSVLVSGGISPGPSPGTSVELLEFCRVNNSPIANICNLPQSLAVDAHCAADVRLDGTCSSDPDGDELTYEWQVDSLAVEGQSPLVSLAPGPHVITLTVNDGQGASSGDSLSLDVVDSTPPNITGLSAIPGALWPPNKRMVHVAVTPIVSDNCSSSVCKIVSVMSKEPAQSDAVAAGDAVITGDLTLNLRADRSAKGNGRVYAITVQCEDDVGNTSERVTTVVVPHDQGTAGAPHS